MWNSFFCGGMLPGFYRVLNSFKEDGTGFLPSWELVYVNGTEFYRVFFYSIRCMIPGFTEFYRVLPGFEFCVCLRGWYRVLPSFEFVQEDVTGFYRVFFFNDNRCMLPGFYRVFFIC